MLSTSFRPCRWPNLAVLLVTLVGWLGRPGVAAAQPGFSAVKRAVDEAIAAGQLPGAVVYVGRGDTLLFHGAFGNRAVAPSVEPMTEDTVFDVASLTKVVATTPAIMALVEEGRIRLADPVARYIPGFEKYGKAGITIRDLMTHVSGLRPDLELEVPFTGAEEAIARAIEEVPVAAPGERFIYSDINFFLLGDIVRRVSGERLDQYAARRIFGPLGMRDTLFLPPESLRPRIAPTERCEPMAWPCSVGPDVPFLRGIVHDPTARRMGGVAGHAGLFSTAADLARYCRMLVQGGSLDRVDVFAPATVARMTSPSTPDGMKDVRGLGWDIDSSYSSNRGDLFPIGSFGHTGFTGTSIWVDPQSSGWVIVLANRVHPDGKGDATPLRSRVASIAAAAMAAGAPRADGHAPPRGSFGNIPRAVSAPAKPGTGATLTGIDVLAAEGFARLRGKRVGLLTNQNGRTRDGRSTIDVMSAAKGLTLVALFSPEHGIRGEVDDKVADGRDEKTGLPIYSLYGETRRPTEAMLAGLDVVVVDLQDIGVRFYSYPTAIAYLMEEAAKRHIAVMVCDRPVPVNGFEIEGPAQDASASDYVGVLKPMPIRHGMTLGELSRMVNAERHIGADLSVVPMQHWRRDFWWDETGLAWVNPSPNMRNLLAATLYPGIGAIEHANLSVGRGTDTPFEQVGAPWVDGVALASALNTRGLEGVRFYPVTFTPAKGAVLGGEACHGVFIVVTDRDKLKPVRVGVEIASALAKTYGDTFKLEPTLALLGPRALLARIRAGEDPAAIARSWVADEARWRTARAKYLLY